MSHIRTVPPAEATGEVAAMYRRDVDHQGYVANYTKAFSLRPAVMDGWRELNGAVRGGMDLRTYELATLAAAQALRSKYCSVAHAKVLVEKFHSPDEVAAIATGSGAAPVDERDRAVMAFAAQVVRDAAAISATDVERLREHGLSDQEIFDVTAAAAARCFFAKVLDALGSVPDAELVQFDPGLAAALSGPPGH
jgi:uncharacterized peroxidase-related enzyme